MSNPIRCSRCGGGNPVGHIFCKHCGARLALSDIPPPAAERHAGRRLLGLFRLVVLLGLAAAVGLILWQSEVRGAVGTPDEAERLYAKLRRLEGVISAGQGVDEWITETEVNAYLARVVEHTNQASSSSPRQVRVTGINLSFTRDHLIALILAEWGPLKLSYEMTGIPRAGEAAFELKLVAARLGHLPLPGAVRDRVARQVAPVFARMNRERNILDHLSGIVLDQGRLRISL